MSTSANFGNRLFLVEREESLDCLFGHQAIGDVSACLRRIESLAHAWVWVLGKGTLQTSGAGTACNIAAYVEILGPEGQRAMA